MGQNLSIGAGCDTKAVVQHELLHALGFYHEQSRSDRDDYVQIWWDQIEAGKLTQFRVNLSQNAHKNLVFVCLLFQNIPNICHVHFLGITENFLSNRSNISIE